MQLGGMMFKTLSDAGAVARCGANWLSGTLDRIATTQGVCVLAVSGGRSPWPMFRQLVMVSDMPWDRIHIVQVDERQAPDGDEERNWTRAQEIFAPVVPVDNLHPMPVMADDMPDAAAEYARDLDRISHGRGVDVAHLGIGPDGHTASLFPDDPILDISDRDVAWTTHAHNGFRRMSLTFCLLAGANHVFWQICGADKQPMLAKLLAGDTSIPAGRVRRDRAIVYADAAAAGDLD